jgi:hypothetical protein
LNFQYCFKILLLIDIFIANQNKKGSTDQNSNASHKAPNFMLPAAPRLRRPGG